MKRLNQDITEEKEQELISKLYEHLGLNEEHIEQDIKSGRLTHNLGYDDNEYFWYMDFTDEADSGAAIDMEGNIVDTEEELNELFM